MALWRQESDSPILPHFAAPRRLIPRIVASLQPLLGIQVKGLLEHDIRSAAADYYCCSLIPIPIQISLSVSRMLKWLFNLIPPPPPHFSPCFLSLFVLANNNCNFAFLSLSLTSFLFAAWLHHTASRVLELHCGFIVHLHAVGCSSAISGVIAADVVAILFCCCCFQIDKLLPRWVCVCVSFVAITLSLSLTASVAFVC